jgi:hypothetical protein
MQIIETSENLNLRQADILKNLLKKPERYVSKNENILSELSTLYKKQVQKL